MGWKDLERRDIKEGWEEVNVQDVHNFPDQWVDEQKKKTREQIKHNFLESWTIHDLLYKVNFHKLRRVQQKTYVALLRMLFMGIDEGYIKLPTGTGKTLFFTEILNALQLAAVLKAPSVDLTAQNLNQLIETWYDKEAIFSIPEWYYDEKEDLYKITKMNSAAVTLEEILTEIKEKLIDNPIVWSTYASLKSLFKNSPELLDKLNQIAKIYVSDEGHETMGNIWNALKEYFMDREHGNPHGKIHILLTATPDRRKKSLRDQYHEIISIKLQECFQDQILTRPWFEWVGKAFLPIRWGLEKKPSAYEIESSGKFIDSTGRPIREVIVDKYAELLEKFVYFPAKFFCSTIKEAKDVERYAREVHGIRTIVQTSETQMSDAEISRMIYHDEVDAVINVKMWVQWSDCRPLRCAARFNASNDPVFKTQGNGRIMRTMREEDVEEIFNNIRNKPKYDSYSDDELKEIIRKSTDNTRIIEPDKWVLTVRKKWKLPRGPKWMWKKRKPYIPTKDDPIDELPNSLEDMFLCDEVDSSYLAQHYPTATVHFTDIKEFFEKEKISSLEELLMQDTDEIITKAGERFQGSKLQRIQQMLSARSLEGLNAIADFMGYKPMSQQTLDRIYNKALRDHIKSQEITKLHEYRVYQWTEESPARFLLWRIKHGWDIWLEKDFLETMQALGVDVKAKIKRFLGTTNPAKLILEWDEKFDKLFDITNDIRRAHGLRSFPHEVRKEKFFTYLGEFCGFDTLRTYFLRKVEKWGFWSIEEAASDKSFIGKVLDFAPEIRNHTLRREMWIHSANIYTLESRRALLRYIYGKNVADETIYKRLITGMKKEWRIYTVFDLMWSLDTHRFWRPADLALYFGYNLDNVPLERLVAFAQAWLKYGLIRTDDINKIPDDIESYRKNRYTSWYVRRKNKVERALGVDIIRKEAIKKGKEDLKKYKAEKKKKEALQKKEMAKKSP